MMRTLKCFKYFVRRMRDIDRARAERRAKVDSVAVELQAKMLKICCVENAEKLAQDETQAINWTKGNDQGSTVEHQPVGKLVQQ